ncbi:MAG: hypothetical protein KME64_27710 [Scytonematopsis contorta HA4267-MV1]|jgi:hypothetical protein|nr:hypothetical protein [Scytonematopsis contorta HA4267-MV1]
MNQKFYRIVATFLLVATVSTGCRSTDDYKKLAETGDKYTQAVDELLTTAGKITIEASSEQLLQEDRRLKPLNITVTATRYQEVSEVDEKRLQLLRDISNHNFLLQAYFQKLFVLADSKAPESAKTQVEGIVGNINKISQGLQKSDLITNPGVFSGISSLIVSSQIRGLLREELEKRNQTIMLELTIQEELLKALSASIEKEIAIIKQIREERFVIIPLTQNELVPNDDSWIETRKQILVMRKKSEEIKQASQKMAEFKTLFQNFVEGKLSLKSLNQFLKDIDSFLAILEENKKAIQE